MKSKNKSHRISIHLISASKTLISVMIPSALSHMSNSNKLRAIWR